MRLLAFVMLAAAAALVSAQAPIERVPTATLVPAQMISLESEADSNSPAVWDWVDGRQSLFVFSSFNGWSTRLFGAQVSGLMNLGRIAFDAPPPHGVWMEAVIPDADGSWYGFYHNERPADICGDMSRMLPRIGAARTTDYGATWEDLGVVLESPPEWHECDTTNRYFVGGVGDFSVMLDHDQRYLYLFFSQYVDREETQGVAVARMPWAYRDEPRGRMSVWWRGMAWVPSRRVSRRGEPPEYIFGVGTPIYRVRDGWHEGQTVDAFWGPSVHWNTYLEQYVMLLNHASNSEWRQEGIYVAFAKTLDNPMAWSTPQRLLSGGEWYPQVMGIESGTGTDKLAGERARFFMSGRSRYFIQFSR